MFASGIWAVPHRLKGKKPFASKAGRSTLKKKITLCSHIESFKFIRLEKTMLQSFGGSFPYPILLVEDDHFLRHVLCSILQEDGQFP